MMEKRSPSSEEFELTEVVKVLTSLSTLAFWSFLDGEEVVNPF